MTADNPSSGDSGRQMESVDKSAHDVSHSVDTTPTSRVAPARTFRESARDVSLMPDTTPATRVEVGDTPNSPRPPESSTLAGDQQ
jgi:hypothetical protein